jgi:hypothetical protein
MRCPNLVGDRPRAGTRLATRRDMTPARSLAYAAAALTLTLAGAARADGPGEMASEPVESGTPGGFEIRIRAPGWQGPMEMPYSEGQPIPSGYHTEGRPILGLVVGGGITFGLAYALTFAVGMSGSNRTGPLAAIPIAGAFIGAATYQGQPGTLVSGITRDALIGLGAVQIAGAALIVGGLVGRKTWLVRDKPLPILPVPIARRDGGGLGFIGTF